jgi:hypothetical protein
MMPYLISSDNYFRKLSDDLFAAIVSAEKKW